jgi:hypothetical protein
MVATMATSQNPKKKTLVRAAYKLMRFEQFEKSGSVLVNSMLPSALHIRRRAIDPSCEK